MNEEESEKENGKNNNYWSWPNGRISFKYYYKTKKRELGAPFKIFDN